MPFPNISFGGQVYLYDDFLGASLNPAIAGQNENSGTSAIVVAQAGGVGGLTTGTTGGNRCQFTTGLNHEVADGSIVIQWRAKPVTSVADVAYFYGATDTVSLEFPIEISGTTITSNATNAVGLMYDTAATTDAWRAVAVNGDADATPVIVQINGVNAAPTADVYEQFRVEITPDGDAVFSYGKENGEEADQGFQEVARIENAVAATALLSPVAAIETRTNAAKTAYVDALLVQSGRDGAY
jgi:hypothetical protein